MIDRSSEEEEEEEEEEDAMLRANCFIIHAKGLANRRKFVKAMDVHYVTTAKNRKLAYFSV